MFANIKYGFYVFCLIISSLFAVLLLPEQNTYLCKNKDKCLAGKVVSSFFVLVFSSLIIKLVKDDDGNFSDYLYAFAVPLMFTTGLLGYFAYLKWLKICKYNTKNCKIFVGVNYVICVISLLYIIYYLKVNSSGKQGGPAFLSHSDLRSARRLVYASTNTDPISPSTTTSTSEPSISSSSTTTSDISSSSEGQTQDPKDISLLPK